MQTVISHGLHLHVRDEGPRDGAVLLFCNSLGTDMLVWDALLPHLPAPLRKVRFDKRGHGLSDASPSPYAMDQLVDDVEAICAALALRRVILVGLSIGGVIGIGLAARRPDLVRGLVLMDTAARIGTAESWEARIRAIREGGLAAMADTILQRWFTPQFLASNPQAALWRNMVLRTSRDGYLGCCTALAAADFTEQAKTLPMPVIAMAGDQDGSTPPELVRATADLCGAPFHVITGAGHLPCVEQPEQTARLITGFVEGIER